MHTYIRSDTVISRVIAGETLIVPIRKGARDLAPLYSLNEVGSSIWQALAKPRTRPEIVRLIEQEFDGDRKRIEQDVELFLSGMSSAGLVRAMGAMA